MRAVVQRVTRSKVTVGNDIVGEIGAGLLILLGVSGRDSEKDASYLADKVINLRVFDDDQGRMDLSITDIGGAALVVSQFTLYGDVTRGRRPSFIDAAPPERANELYETFVTLLKAKIPKVETGRFQAMMDVELVNDGPVTILIDSEKKF